MTKTKQTIYSRKADENGFCTFYRAGYRYVASVETRNGELQECSFLGDDGREYAEQYALTGIRKGAKSAVVYELTETGRRRFDQSYDWRDIQHENRLEVDERFA